MTASSKTLIRGASIVSMDRAIGDLPTGDILLIGDRIAEVGPSIHASDAEIIDATDMIASPGFVDTHRHVWQTQLKGVAGDWSLFDYGCLMRTMYSVCYEPADAYLGNYVGALDAINAGITCIVDHSHLQVSAAHSDALVTGIRDSGIRGTFCYGVFRNPKYKPGESYSIEEIISEAAGTLEDFHRENARRVRETHFAVNDGRLRFGIATSEFAAFDDPRPVIEEVTWARTLEPHRLGIHIGMGVNEDFRIIPILHEAGLLRDDLLFVHGSHLTDSDLALLKTHGGWLSTTPETELQMGMGYPVLERVSASGSTPSLGIDIVSNYAGDMFAQMRLMLQTIRFRDFDQSGRGIPVTPRYPARAILETATLGGARVLGLEHEIGSLTPGKKADLILTRTDSINMSPILDPVSALVFYANAGEVDSVWVDGVPRKRAGALVDVNWGTVHRDISESRKRIDERFSLIPEPKIRQAWAPIWGIEVP